MWAPSSYVQTGCVLVILVLLDLSAAQAARCSVCGEGLKVGAPGNVFMLFGFAGGPSQTCGALEEEGRAGHITAANCSYLPAMIHEACDCKVDKCAPCAGNNGCSICGAGRQVGNREEFIVAPPYGSSTCSDLEVYAEVGFVDQEACDHYSDFLEACQCQPVAEPSLSLCHVCDDGSVVGAPDALIPSPFPYAGQNCSWLDNAGKNGSISRWECRMLQDPSIEDVCQCAAPTNPPATKPPATNPPSNGSGESIHPPISNDNSDSRAFWILAVIFVVGSGLVVQFTRLKRKRTRQIGEHDPEADFPAAHEELDPPANEEEFRARVLATLFPPEKTPAPRRRISITFMRQEREVASTCSICLDDIACNMRDGTVSGLCNHSFHRECIMTWLERDNDDCPLCRQKMWEPEQYRTVETLLRRRIGQTADEAMIFSAQHNREVPSNWYHGGNQWWS